MVELVSSLWKERSATTQLVPKDKIMLKPLLRASSLLCNTMGTTVMWWTTLPSPVHLHADPSLCTWLLLQFHALICRRGLLHVRGLALLLLLQEKKSDWLAAVPGITIKWASSQPFKPPLVLSLSRERWSLEGELVLEQQWMSSRNSVWVYTGDGGVWENGGEKFLAMLLS